jgi:hypothetical protein
MLLPTLDLAIALAGLGPALGTVDIEALHCKFVQSAALHHNAVCEYFLPYYTALLYAYDAFPKSRHRPWVGNLLAPGGALTLPGSLTGTSTKVSEAWKPIRWRRVCLLDLIVLHSKKRASP